MIYKLCKWGILPSIIFWAVVLWLLAGCSYNGINDHNIEWPGQTKEFYKSPRQIYFGGKDEILDNTINFCDASIRA